MTSEDPAPLPIKRAMCARTADWGQHSKWSRASTDLSSAAWKDNMLEVLELKANVKTYVQALNSSCEHSEQLPKYHQKVQKATCCGASSTWLGFPNQVALFTAEPTAEAM
ncbi:unnamed protein product [Cladocopium goreaui]|uniref:Uncharacterized protein n=1 Tax=Cladocopium goreaui TaxID=2562237 RepID=A0A9P1GL63_9DINO|nr:unnamed protein product [Cladocopium goreaui]